MGWVRRTYDQNGRLIASDSFAGSGYPFPWGGNGANTGGTSYSYNANAVTFYDEAGKSRTSTFDALGCLSMVNEGGFNSATFYAYGFGDRLLSVQQAGQSRTFNYDGAGRLLWANNPESGLTSYKYDGNGNVTERTGDRTIVACYGNVSGQSCDHQGYDALDRVTKKSYSDGTPSVTYYYHGPPSSPGACASNQMPGFIDRQTEAFSSVSSTDYCRTTIWAE